MTALLEIELGAERLALAEPEVDFGEARGAPVVASFDPPGTVSLHVYGREIADGALTCSLGPRRALVRMDVRLAARLVAEALAAGLPLPGEDADALRAALN